MNPNQSTRRIYRCKRLLMAGITVVSFVFLSACSNTYYNALEKVGIHKRELLVSRVEDTTEAQEKGQKEFVNAIDKFKTVVKVPASELEDTYNKLNDAYERAKDASDNIHDKIGAVESVASALFEEWEDELDEYSSENLRQKSEQKLKSTKKLYQSYITSAKQSEKKLKPALTTMYDQVLYLKHNLNVSAVGAIEGEVVQIDKEVQEILASIRQSIDKANKFIKEIG